MVYCLCYGLDERYFDSSWGAREFSPLQNVQTTLNPNQLPIPWVQKVISLGVKWPRHEVGHSFPSRAKIKIEYSYTCIPLMPSR